ncbi:MAG TPA: hypothetical protein VLA00_05800 [Xanthobacteraceae bacterium]|nr:hypothetical protein [Xanthobacteraceae bacterium]
MRGVKAGRAALSLCCMLAVLAASMPAASAATARKPAETAKEKAARAKAAKDKPVKNPGVWTAAREEEGVTLQFRIPGTPAPTLFVACRPDGGLFQVVAEVSPPKARPGDAVKLVIGNGRVTVEFAASVFPSATDGRMAVEAQVTLEPKLVELFKTAEQLRIVVPGATETLPLASLQKRIADFEKACLKPAIVPARAG